jgi:hypothetical protein
MVLFILGVSVGFCFTIWYLVFDFTHHFDYSVTTNIVIAFATLMAASIHFDAVIKQRRERIWEINKDILLNLSQTVSDALEQSIKMSDPMDEPEWDAGIHKAHNKAISVALKIYRPLLSKELISAIEAYQKEDAEIKSCVMEDEMSNTDGYCALSAAQETLHSIISKYIKKVSGL